MKKLILLLCVSFAALVSYSQKLNFKKGELAPGKIITGRSYEEFIEKNISVTDERNIQYSFVKADLSVTSKNGKTIKLSLNKPSFTEAQLSAIIQASKDGAVYTFSNVVVKDQSGKVFTIDTVEYEYLTNQ